MQRIIQHLVFRTPKLTLFILALITTGLALGIAKIKIHDDINDVIPKDNPAYVAMSQLEEQFGSLQTIVMMLTPKNGTLFTPENLNQLQALNRDLQYARPIAHVQSLATTKRFVRDAEGGLESKSILEKTITSQAQALAVKAEIVKNPQIKRAFLAKDENRTAFYLDPKLDGSDKEIVAVLAKIIAPYQAFFTIDLSGMSVIRQATSQTIKNDMLKLTPAVVLVLTIILALSLRKISGTLLTLGLIVLSILPAAGLMGFLGISLSAVNNTFPVLILATACADAMHILSTYYSRCQEEISHLEILKKVVGDLSLPIFLTSATTFLGFLSLISSPIPPLGGLGIVVAAGVAWAWVLSILGLPALLVLMKKPKVRSQGKGFSLDFFFDFLTKISTKHALPTIIVIVLSLATLGLLGLPKLQREVSVERFFSTDAPVRQSLEKFDEAFQASSPVEILLAGNVEDPAFMQAIFAFDQQVQDLPQVGSVDSIAEIVADIQEGFTGKRSMPSDQQALAQSLLLYRISGSPERYERFVSTDGTQARITIRLPNLSTTELASTIDQIKTLADKTIGPQGSYSLTGKGVFLDELNHLVVRSIFSSMLFSLVMVFLISVLTFKKLIEGLESMIPLSLAILGVFSLMGILGLPITVASGLICAIVIGVGVDFAIHILARWDLLTGMEPVARAEETLHEVGRPILFNALAVALGLGVMSLSGFQPVRQLGILASISMISSALGALVVLPIIKTFRTNRMHAKEAKGAKQ